MWVILDYTRGVIALLSLVLKFGLDPIYSFGDFYILPFWLEIACSRIFLGSFRGIFHVNMVIHRSNPPKGPSLRGTTSFEP